MTIAKLQRQLKYKVSDEEWFHYIFANRAGREDTLAMYDVIIGPIANDTIYDTWGILTSGLISAQTALQVLMQGPAYQQVVIKSERAVRALED